LRTYVEERGFDSLLFAGEQIVSELVGNAVLHAGGRIHLRFATDVDGVLITVSDDSPVTPELKAFSPQATTGRGIRILHALASDYGVDARAGGKSIWARLSMTDARADEQLADVFAADLRWDDLEQPVAGAESGSPVSADERKDLA
jgi:anti-sigma regulatory factor (Ser/Thr protein kinase)